MHILFHVMSQAKARQKKINIDTKIVSFPHLTAPDIFGIIDLNFFEVEKFNIIAMNR